MVLQKKKGTGKLKIDIGNVEDYFELLAKVTDVEKYQFRAVMTTLTEVKAFDIARVPRAQSKNTQEKRKAGIGWGEKCKIAVPTAPTKAKKTPKVTDDLKRKAHKVQRWIDGKNFTEYFSYRTRDRSRQWQTRMRTQSSLTASLWRSTSHKRND